MRSHFCVLVASLLMSSISFADFFKVGNAGEGILIDTGVYTRDLYDYNLHVSPWIGLEASPSLKMQVAAWNSLGLSEDEIHLLARKLTDLNKSHKYLGDEIFEALRFFTWQWTDQDLVLIEPDEVRTPVPPGQRIPIANRYLKSILVQRQNFARLDPANKIALLLHEAVYSLMKYRNGRHVRGPSLSITRQIVANFFDQKGLNSTAASDLMERYLLILRDFDAPDFLVPPISPGQTSPQSAFLFYDLTLNDFTPVSWFIADSSLPKAENQKRILEACRHYLKQQPGLGYLRQEFAPVRRLKVHSYPRENNIEQFALRIEYEREEARSWNLDASEEKACIQEVTKLLQ